MPLTAMSKNVDMLQNVKLANDNSQFGQVSQDVMGGELFLSPADVAQAPQLMYGLGLDMEQSMHGLETDMAQTMYGFDMAMDGMDAVSKQVAHANKVAALQKQNAKYNAAYAKLKPLTAAQQSKIGISNAKNYAMLKKKEDMMRLKHPSGVGINAQQAMQGFGADMESTMHGFDMASDGMGADMESTMHGLGIDMAETMKGFDMASEGMGMDMQQSMQGLGTNMESTMHGMGENMQQTMHGFDMASEGMGMDMQESGALAGLGDVVSKIPTWMIVVGAAAAIYFIMKKVK